MVTIDDRDLAALNTVTTSLSASFASIDEAQMDLPTPCADWSLTALVDHVVGGNWFTLEILAGAAADEALNRTMARFEAGGATPAQAVSSAADQLASFAEPGVLTQTWHHIAGDLTGRQILRIRLHDLIVHHWDIEQTLRPPASVTQDLLDWANAEIADPASLSAKVFEFDDVASNDRDPGRRYLQRFGR